MGKINNIWRYISNHKYLLTCIIGIFVVGFVDENSMRRYIELKLRSNELKAEIQNNLEQYEKDSISLRSLECDPKAVERIARSRYLMKRSNEDVFIFSD